MGFLSALSAAGPALGGAGGLIGSIGSLIQGQKGLNQSKHAVRLAAQQDAQNFSLQERIHNENFGLASDQLQWQKDMQSQAWAREDSAVSRRAADLENAGLSKTLAAGGAASSSSPIRLEPAQRGIPQVGAREVGAREEASARNFQMSQAWLNLAQQSREIAKTDAQLRIMREEEKGKRLGNRFLESTLLARTHQEIARGSLLEHQQESAAAKAAYDLRLGLRAQERANLEMDLLTYARDRSDWGRVESRWRAELTEAQLAQLKYNLDRWRLTGLPTNSPLNGYLGTALQLGLVSESAMSHLNAKMFGGVVGQ